MLQLREKIPVVRHKTFNDQGAIVPMMRAIAHHLSIEQRRISLRFLLPQRIDRVSLLRPEGKSMVRDAYLDIASDNGPALCSNLFDDSPEVQDARDKFYADSDVQKIFICYRKAKDYLFQSGV